MVRFLTGFYQIDDHEIVNDITNLQTDRAETLQTALGVWRTYVASTNPPAGKETVSLVSQFLYQT